MTGDTSPQANDGSPRHLEVTVNGERMPLPEPTSVADLLRTLGYEPRGIAIAVDGDVVPRSAWTTTRLTDGVAVEILAATQGG